MNNIPDQQQRQQALDITNSYIVQAPAGSGKTTLLIQRYLKLLGQACNKPEEILAITFTRKAATQMRTRIVQALTDPEQRELMPLTRELARKVLVQNNHHNWNILDNPNRMRIQTIDSLCHSIVRQMPISANICSDNALLNDQELRISYQTAARHLLDSLNDDEPYADALGEILLHLDNNFQLAEQLLINMLGKRDQWLPHIMQDKNLDDIRIIMESALDEINDSLICKCEQLLPHHLHTVSSKLVAHSFETLQKDSVRLEHDKLIQWQAVAKLLLTKNGNWRKKVDKRLGFNSNERELKQELMDLLTELAPNESLREALIDIQHAPPRRYDDEQWQTISNLVILLQSLAAHLKLVFRDYGAVDYIEMAIAALDALGSCDNPTDLALRLDYRLQHILVDEFQDTSVMQYELLEKLTSGWQIGDGRTLFLVGDPMQSIYKFREAKVGLFIKAKREGINDIHLEPITLHANFRSTNTLVTWYNKTFRSVMPAHEEIVSGAIPFIDSIAIKDKENNSSVNVYALPDKEYELEAQEIVGIINQTKNATPQDSIAILVRYRSHLTDIIKTLTEANIPFQAVEVELLTTHPLIRDLLALTKALLNPNDRVAWLSILRAPWCGLTLSDLYHVATASSNEPIWHALQDWQQITDISNDGKTRLTNIVSVLTEAISRRRRVTLRRLVSDVWQAVGGLSCLKSTQDHLVAERFFALLTKSEAANTIQDVSLLEAELTRLYQEPQQHESSLVQIMTIHKAKGLEFDTVILPGLNRRVKNDGESLLAWIELPDLILAPIKQSGVEFDPIYRYLQYEQHKRTGYETGRLLYVAATRAKKRLHLLANYNDKANSGSLLELVWNQYQPTKIVSATTPQSINVDQTIENRALMRLPIKLMTLNSLPHLAVVDNIDIEYQLNNCAQHVGQVIHAVLCRLSKTDLSEYNHTKEIDSWRKQLQQLGTFNDLEHHIANIGNAINNTISSKIGRWILDKSHREAKSEFEICFVINEKKQHLIIDRTFIDKNRRWVIDYKTALPDKEQNIDDFLHQQKHKYESQLQLYAKAMQEYSDIRVQTALYFPALALFYEVEP